MGSLIQPTPVSEEPDTSRRIIIIAIAAVVLVALLIAFLLRQRPVTTAPVPPYASQLKISDLKMSQAQNFVGATETYIDGTLSNAGDKSVTRAVVRVTFRDPYGQVAQIENVPIRILQTSGAYSDTTDLASAPLVPQQSKPFRLIFEHISDQWSQGYPEIQVIDVQIK